MYDLTKKYIYISEYFNPKPIEILYHNERERLYKRDFAKKFGNSTQILNSLIMDFNGNRIHSSQAVCDITNCFYFQIIFFMKVKLHSLENICDMCCSDLTNYYIPIKTKRNIKTFLCQNFF